MSVPSGTESGSPCSAASRPASVRAAATDTCWPEHRPHRELVRIDVARHTQAGMGANERREQPVACERVSDGERIGVEVEQAPAALHGGGEVAQVLEPELAVDVSRLFFSGGPAQRHHAQAVRQIQHAPVGAVDDFLDPRHRPLAEEAQQAVEVERGAISEAQLQRRPAGLG